MNHVPGNLEDNCLCVYSVSHDTHNLPIEALIVV